MSTQTLPPVSQLEKLERLARWAGGHGASLHANVWVGVEEGKGKGAGLFVGEKRDCCGGRDRAAHERGEGEGEGRVEGEAVKMEDIANCPPGITLSFLNAVDAGGEFGMHEPAGGGEGEKAAVPSLPGRLSREAPPHVVGRFFLMRQVLLGEGSFWGAYIDALPPAPAPRWRKGRSEGEECWALPPFWMEDERQCLQGTNVGSACEKIREQTRGDWEDAIRVLKGYDGDIDWEGVYTRELYEWAYCVFSSRSFRPRLVIPERILGEALEKVNEVFNGGEEGMGNGRGKVKAEDFGVLLPLVDLANHHPMAKVRWDLEEGKGVVLRVRGGIGVEGGERKEVFNWYGDKTNAELLLSYGFMTPYIRGKQEDDDERRHNAYVHVRKARKKGVALHGNGEEEKAKDFLISLEPMTDEEGMSDRSRGSVLVKRDAVKVNGFEHFDQSMVWDILVNGICEGDLGTVKGVWGVKEDGAHDEREGAGGDSEVDIKLLTKVLGTYPFPNEDAQQIVALVLNVLVQKVRSEKSNLENAGKKTEMEVEEGPRDLRPERGETGRLKLIADYRREVRWVLEAAERSILAAVVAQHGIGS
ncbi:hypothetical protein MKZ38_008268 [Zalerion maritima]|uniref:SET domain-containing protein n=1 Tax=Zalerion maritima TaxID=339359 RepID=A0AAD5RUA6_9PEZI|nr:hypothetical protein MKZ38_008268 [Zalerion maritima]